MLTNFGHLPQAWGGDLIGMTAMPEARLAREASMCYSLIEPLYLFSAKQGTQPNSFSSLLSPALVSDYDCWKPHAGPKKVLLQEIIANMSIACNNCVSLIEAVLSSDHVLNGNDCICHKSIELAVWTDKEVIPAAQMEKLQVLFE